MPKRQDERETKPPGARLAHLIGANGIAAAVTTRSSVSRARSSKTRSIPEPHYTVAEVAAIYRVTAKTVRNWIDHGELGAWRKNRMIRISHSALAALDKKQRNSIGSRRLGKRVR